MDIFTVGSRPALRAKSEWFTGTVWQDPIVEAPDPARNRSLRVHFEPGARSAWHTHPLGQTLYVTSGVGRVALRGQSPRIIRAGDSVWIPPGVEHWHGAGPDTAMEHIAIQEAENGFVATWMEHVSDEDYGLTPVAP